MTPKDPMTPEGPVTPEDDGTTRLLSPLTRSPSARLDWRDPAALRRSHSRRRYGTGVGLLSTVVIIALIVVLVPRLRGDRPRPAPAAGNAGLAVSARQGSAMQFAANARSVSSPDPTALDPTALDPTGAARTASAEQAFAVALLKQLNRRDASNLSVSPLSLALALSILQNGAAGPTRDEIMATLKSTGLSPGQHNAGWASLLADLAQASAKDKITLQSANSLWLQHGLIMKPDFMTALARYYAAGVWQVDFAQHLDDATTDLNAWAKKHTNGRIDKLFDEGQLSRDTELVLANAIYFNAAWRTPFNPALTVDGQFTLASGSTASTKFMKTAGTTAVARNASYDAAQLPYTGGRFAALAIMPRAGQSLADFTATLTPAALTGIASTLKPAPTTVSLPRFTTTSDLTLTDSLRQLGMPTAFTDAADFSAMSPTSVKVDTVVQRVFVSVGEKGTEAAAVTGSSMVATAATADPLSFDRPFLFLVRDTVTGTILFASQVQNPAD